MPAKTERAWRKPILPTGSTAWLLAYEMRIAWRNTWGRRGGGVRGQVIVLVALVAFTAFVGVPAGLALRHWNVPIEPFTILLADLGLIAVGSLLLSQTLSSAAEALYQRGDLDLLFSAPLAARKTLTVRFLALALNVFLAVTTLISPLVIPVAVIGHPAWLSVYLVLAALALTATTLGLVLAMGMFAAIGPRRTRAVAQVSSAIIGAGFFLASQAQNMFGGHATHGAWAQARAMAADPSFRLPPLADAPLRAMLGEPLPLAAMAGGSLVLFFAVAAWLGRRFAADAAVASGADSAAAPKTGGRVSFSGSAFVATLRKELRLIWRDAGLISQVLLRVLYMLPLALALIRIAGSAQTMALASGAGGLAFLAGQVSGSLAWIAISAEDAPELLASAPTSGGVFRWAKLTAAFLPMAVLLAPLMVLLTVLSPLTGVAAMLGCVAAALASGLINIWHQKPSKRAEFRRRRGSSWYSMLGEAMAAGLIAVATGFAAAASVWALVPAGLCVLLMFGLRRSDAQIARAMLTFD